MTDPSVVISSHGAELASETREELERRCQALAREFPETTHFEITVAQEGSDHVLHGHVTGKSTEVASQASAEQPIHAVERLMDALEKQLRRGHDKRIFAKRRVARRHSPKNG